MRAGLLRDRVTIQQSTVGKDAEGGKTETWATFARVWVGIRPLAGRERYAQDQIQAEVDHEITLRTLVGFNPSMRILCDNGRVFSVRAVQQYPKEGKMVCLAMERV